MSDATATAMWDALVTAALLGTDRRPLPDLPAGSVADVVADGVHTDPAERMLAAVATLAAARRAAFVALPPASPLPAARPDAVPLVTPAASATWREIVADWPVLEDEWLLLVGASDRRLPPDVLVDALARHRGDPVRWARVARAGGQLTGWLVDLEPSLAAKRPVDVSAESTATLPDLPIPPELVGLLGADAHTFTREFAARVDGAGPAHKPVLVNVLARCHPAVLDATAAALAARPFGLALALAELCRLRARVHAEFAHA